MSVFKDYEKTVIKHLTRATLADAFVTKVIADAPLECLNHTGNGYLLTVSYPGLPHERVVCHQLGVSGFFDDIQVGFLVILMDEELTLECFGYADPIPSNVRERDVSVRCQSD